MTDDLRPPPVPPLDRAADPLALAVAENDISSGWRVLLVEDDDGDALLVREMLADGVPGAAVERVIRLADARRAARRVDCVLLDLGLPDCQGLDGVEQIVGHAPDTAVVVLTGAASERLGMAAVAAGAQDYLVKGRVDDQLLARSVRYAIERQRAARLARDLFAAERRRADNTRMERALTPPLLLHSPDVEVAVRYRAGREGAELGGDFYDAVEAADGRVTVMIGDVAGHGPDAAALGARLRSAWRALTLACLDQPRVLEVLDRFLRTEVENLTFASLATLDIAQDRREGVLLLAGHPPPIAVGPAGRPLGEGAHGHLLGVMPAPSWTPVTVPLGPGAEVLLYTDGLIEGRTGPDRGDRLGIAAAAALVDELAGRGHRSTVLLDSLLADVQRRNGGPLTDDVALCLVSIPAGPPAQSPPPRREGRDGRGAADG
ncbi:MAG TPA: SpoIIE family protein phosphatase [Acidimicrobiales bacterium]|nr:SpoIIE family protein phosphatase [Acidimicrobiales bacterium]